MPIAPDVENLRGSETAAPIYEGLLAQVQVLEAREGGLIEALVPTELIDHEEVPVDNVHVQEIVASMQKESRTRGGTGQHTPTFIGEVAGLPKFLIIDGFHRDSAVVQLDLPTVRSTIRLNSTMEDIIDLRIEAANMHASVGFARSVEWIEDAWRRTEWAKRGISALQAFGLTKSVRMGPLLGLSDDEVVSIQLWAVKKCEQWRMPHTTVYNHLNTAAQAAPELISRTRLRGSSDEGSVTITPGQLAIISSHLVADYDRQLLAVNIVGGLGLRGGVVKTIVEKIKGARTLEEAKEIAETTDWKGLSEATRSPARKTIARKSPPVAPAESLKTRTVYVRDSEALRPLARRHVLSELELAQASLQSLVFSGVYVAPVASAHEAPGLLVQVDGDHEISARMGMANTGLNVEQFRRTTQGAGTRMMDMLQRKYGLLNPDIRPVVEKLARDRVVADMQKGDLRFISIGDRAITHQDLLYRSLEHEVIRRTKGIPGPSAMWGDAERVTMPFEDLIQAVPALDPKTLRAIVTHGLRHISFRTTATLLDRPHEQVRMLLQKGIERVAGLAAPSEEAASDEAKQELAS